MDLPPLLAGSMTLPPDVHAISHIFQLVNEYLLPITVDAAVYNDLRRVIQRFGAYRAWTVRAVDGAVKKVGRVPALNDYTPETTRFCSSALILTDLRIVPGAAVRGRLSIVQWLYSTRNEGCSAVAFTGAAANGHLQTLQRLVKYFPQYFRAEHCLISATENGRANIVDFYTHKSSGLTLSLPLKRLLQGGKLNRWRFYCLVRIISEELSLLQRRMDTLRYSDSFIGRRYNVKLAEVNAALEKAAKLGHTDVIKLLLPNCNEIGTRNALRSAAKWGEADVVQLLLVTCKFGKVAVSHALQKAAERSYYDVVKLLIDNFPNDDENEAIWHPRGDALTVRSPEEQIYKSLIGVALRSATKRCDVDIVKMLVERFPFPSIGYPVSSSRK